MRKTLLLTLSLISAFSVFSQHDSLLKQYKFRIDHYRALNFYANGGGQLNNTELFTGTRRSSSSGGSFGAAYYAVKSTDRVLFTGSASVTPHFNTSKTKEPSETDKYRSFSVFPRISVLNKWFSGNNFIEAGADVSSNIYSNKNNFQALLRH